MPPPQKGKAPTKGAKQILKENASTIAFYRNMSLGATLTHVSAMCIMYTDELSMGIIFLNILAVGLHLICYKTMQYISQTKYSDTDLVGDPGLDLNMEGGMGEHVKDIVILISVTQLFALISSYFWFLLLLLPARAFWLVWTNFLGPWFFQEAPVDSEQDDKKRKKMERKMKRYQQ